MIAYCSPYTRQCNITDNVCILYWNIITLLRLYHDTDKRTGESIFLLCCHGIGKSGIAKASYIIVHSKEICWLLMPFTKINYYHISVLYHDNIQHSC